MRSGGSSVAIACDPPPRCPACLDAHRFNWPTLRILYVATVGGSLCSVKHSRVVPLTSCVAVVCPCPCRNLNNNQLTGTIPDEMFGPATLPPFYPALNLQTL